ncbi:MAG TPA: RNA polymerase sigma factor [Prolixibacteraceae bacterium]|nr:RNA polymerase sigma factor [Prolixibacteraceae bacterium]
MNNPFQVTYPDQEEATYVKLAIEGDKKAAEQLILHHQLFIYNLALKMTKNVEDAEDLTQEVFIKALTALSNFKGKSKFRTWLYRIAVNHFLNAKKGKSELISTDFKTFFDNVDTIPDYDFNPQEQKEIGETIEELRISCTTGMLLCLDREQRIVFILGEMFNIDHNLGSEIMGITPGNFRIKLMRVRNDFYNWMNNRCGLINKANPCRCEKKTKAFIDAGFVDPNNLKFNTRYKQRIEDLSRKEATPLVNTMEDLHRNIFKQDPFQELPSSTRIMNEVLNNEMIKHILNF